MPLGYDPNNTEKGGRRFAPIAGVYRFVVKEAKEETYKSGNDGLTLKLKVDVPEPPPFDVNSFARMTYEKMTWMIKAACESTGVRFNPPPEASDFINRQGRAEFRVEEFNGYQNLVVEEFLPQSKDNVPF